MNSESFHVNMLRTQRIYKRIRKPKAPPTRIERPEKGRIAYKRPRNKKELYDE